MDGSPCSPKAPIIILKPKLLMAEGADAYWFCVWALKAYGLTGFQVIDSCGNAELPAKLKALKSATGFEEHAEAVVVVRDAETSADSATASVQGALRGAGLSVPDKPFEITQGKPRTAFVLFPGLDDKGKPIQTGTLEDLCLATVESRTMLDCVDAFLSCCKDAGADMRHRHKMKLHAYLAGHDKFVGKKVGEAAKANAWNWEHSSMRPFKELLCNL